MSSDFNTVIMLGRLTAKPEKRVLPSGDSVATFSVASSHSYKTKAGEEKEETCFIDVTVFRKQADVCAQYLVKGQKVLVEGRLSMRKWETQAGEKRVAYEIRANTVRFLEKPKGAAGAGDAPPLGDDDVPAESDGDDGPIPF